MAKAKPRFVVSLDRTDGGEPLVEHPVHDVQLLRGVLTIVEGESRLFAGDAWSWFEVHRIEDVADVSLIARPTRAPRSAPTRPVRQTRRSGK